MPMATAEGCTLRSGAPEGEAAVEEYIVAVP